MTLTSRITPAVRSCLLACCLLAACAPAPASPPNVVVLVVDTLRADRLGVLGNTRGLTPFLDALAERSVVFHHAYAASPWTQPSVASLFTSRFQSQHGIVSAASRLVEAEVTLAELLREGGYATAAFSANALIAPTLGFGQGFDEYQALWTKPPDQPRQTPGKYRAPDLNALARAWLERVPAGKPFFLYLQYMEPHTPYSPPDVVLDRILAERPHPDLDGVNGAMLLGNLAAPDSAALRDIADVYDAEVASVDAGIRDLFAILQARRVLDHTVVVITADHGEGFLEHGFMGHGGTLYEEVIHVPLLLTLPGGAQRADVHEPVSLLDVAPTLLELVGLSVPPSFEGRSLVATFSEPGHPWRAGLGDAPERDAAPRPVFSEHIVPHEKNEARIKPHERAIVMNRRKLILGVDGERESYDLARDPSEHTPLADGEIGPLAEALGAFRGRVAGAIPSAPPIDPELRTRMRALGYTD